MRLPESLQVQMVETINKYFTPFAIVLVGLGLSLSQPAQWITYTSLGLLAFTFVFNFTTAAMIKDKGKLSPRMAMARQFTNLAINVILVYLLGGYWTPVWLLFVLTPAATALYSDRKRTIITALGVAFLLLATHGARRLNAPVDWGRTLIEATFIVFLSLFLHDIANTIRLAETGKSLD